LTTENHKLFSYLLFIHNKRLRNKFNKIDWKFFKYNSYLRFTKRRSFISCLELYFNNGIQYATSPGSKARLLERYNHIKCCTIQLPSKEVKLFSFNATCNSTPLLLKNRNKLLFDSKRYNRSKGFGPKVRGVAMNAIDHPHGGKTKSIKFPKTPWGLPTKLK
jgi:large subunit ribosomal protein L2